ncbi:MAG TPA: hypothetical protein VM120_24885 [Bryobacteraceae bacterium]|nr:hypothetical protein [Bryobacteraceae bacterium]
MEPFLSRLYADPGARARFLADPLTEARNAGLSDEQAKAVVVIDPEELTVAGRSFDHKRGH